MTRSPTLYVLSGFASEMYLLSSGRAASAQYSEEELQKLPEPVRRYLRYSLQTKQSGINFCSLKQHGVFRSESHLEWCQALTTRACVNASKSNSLQKSLFNPTSRRQTFSQPVISQSKCSYKHDATRNAYRLRANQGMKASEGWKTVKATQHFSVSNPGWLYVLEAEICAVASFLV